MVYEYRGIAVKTIVIEGGTYDGLQSLAGPTEDLPAPDKEKAVIILSEESFARFIKDLQSPKEYK